MRLARIALLASIVLMYGAVSGYTTTETTEPVPASTTSPSSEPSASVSPTEAEGVVPEGGGGGTLNNEVVVRNITDGHFANRTRSGIAHVTGDTATNQNAAAAVSSCNDCRTVAVAIQIVLVQRSDAREISPRNLAIALNQNCSGCETFAGAYQYVLTTGSLVRFSPTGLQQLAALESQIRSLAATDGMPFPELDARIASLVHQMWAVVDQELVKIGVRPNGTPYEESEYVVDDSTPSPTVSPSETIAEPSPSETVVESPTPEESPTPTPEETSPSPSSSPSESSSPEEEASPEPSPSPSPS